MRRSIPQRHLSKTADCEEEEVEAEGQEEAICKEVRDPGCPTSEERERHYKTHVPFRPWCAVCVSRQRVLKTHIIARSLVGNMRVLLLRLITNLVNLVKMNTTKEQH